MAERDIKPAQIDSALRELLKQLSQGRVASLKQFAEVQEVRAARLAEAEERLTAALGEEHPRVRALRAAAAATEELKGELGTTAKRLDKLPELKENERMVHGTLLSADGSPAKGRRVQVSDPEGKYARVLPKTTSGEFGDFALVYGERHLATLREAGPELHVMVRDARGRLLYTSRDTVSFEAGRVEYFEIVLPGSGRTPRSRRSRRREG